MDARGELKDFLRSRRAARDPSAAGLEPDDSSRRRVPGLRREEVARLAGISHDYYVRLEQGRTTQVSASVVEGLARALGLTPDESDHLANLLGPPRAGRAGGPQSKARSEARPETRPEVRPALRAMLDAVEGPAFLVGRRTEVLAVNRAAGLVFEGLGEPPFGRTLARYVFLHPFARSLYRDRAAATGSVAAMLRLESGRRPDDPRLTALVGDLAVRSKEFRAVWARHGVSGRGHGVKVLEHPLAGPLRLNYETLLEPQEGITLSLMAAADDTTASSLALLASWGDAQAVSSA